MAENEAAITAIAPSSRRRSTNAMLADGNEAASGAPGVHGHLASWKAILTLAVLVNAACPVASARHGDGRWGFIIRSIRPPARPPGPP